MSEKNDVPGQIKTLSMQAVMAFAASLLLCTAAIFLILNGKMSYEKSLLEQIALEKSAKINEVISRVLYKTQILSAFVVQKNGEIEGFETVAATIVDDPVILNVLLAPDGVVSHVYPLQGNEAVIDLDFFAEGAGNREAMLAKELGELVFGGPFDLIQGGQALVGRLPVWTHTPEGASVFWGLISVTLKFPDVLDSLGLDALEVQGLSYNIWRVNPDDGQKQYIAVNGDDYREGIRCAEKKVSIFNAEWHFCVYPLLEWYQRTESWLMILVALCISCLVFATVQNNAKLKVIKGQLETISWIDSLTGINNRRYFIKNALAQVDRAQRLRNECFIVIFDLDCFKHINDTHGHPVGDKALKAVAHTTQGILRSYDLLARYGGEEFIILLSDLSLEDALNLVERIRIRISEIPMEHNGKQVPISASFGVARAVSDLTEAIKEADIALYKAKEDGRNKTIFYGDLPG